MFTLVYLDAERRLKVYPEGGRVQERRVPGIGWVLADDEDWDDC